MDRYKETSNHINQIADDNTSVIGSAVLLMAEMALSLASIADSLTGDEVESNATSSGDGKKDPEGGTQEWRVINKEAPVPVSWIEKEIEFLKSQDNEFAGLAASNISGMLNKWRDEQNGIRFKESS